MAIQLLCAYVIKHFICDFTLQGHWMALEKYKNWPRFFFPLLAHSAVHTVGAFLIGFVWSRSWGIAFLVALIDFVTHFVFDKMKCIVVIKDKLNTQDRLFWIFVGADQMLHFISYIAQIWIVMNL